MRIFDRQEWLRVNRARARIKVFVDKYGIDELRQPGRGGARGRLGRRTRLLDRASGCSSTTSASRAPAPPPSPGTPERRPARVRALPRDERAAEQKQEGFVTVEVKVTRGDLTPEQFRGLAQIMRELLRAATRARPCSRTSCCAGCARSRVYDVWRALSELGLGDAGLARDRATSSPAPAPTRASSASPARWASTRPSRSASRDADRRPADAADPHQDERLPERLRPAPRGRHRLLRRLDQGRASTRSPPTSRTSAASTKAARSPSASGSSCACPPSACPTRSSAGSATTSPHARRARRGARSRARRARPRSRSRSRISRCLSTSAWRP